MYIERLSEPFDPFLFTPPVELVEQDSWGTSRSTLITEHIGPCAVIAVTNRNQGRGYLGHFLAPANVVSSPSNNFFDEIYANEIGKQLDAWVGGASFLSKIGSGPDEDDLTHEDYELHNTENHQSRFYIVEKLLDLGISENYLHIDWSDENENIDHVALDARENYLKICPAED
jgi:hypothetical protein